MTIQKAKYYIFDPTFTRFDSPWVYIYINGLSKIKKRLAT